MALGQTRIPRLPLPVPSALVPRYLLPGPRSLATCPSWGGPMTGSHLGGPCKVLSHHLQSGLQTLPAPLQTNPSSLPGLARGISWAASGPPAGALTRWWDSLELCNAMAGSSWGVDRYPGHPHCSFLQSDPGRRCGGAALQ